MIETVLHTTLAESGPLTWAVLGGSATLALVTVGWFIYKESISRAGREAREVAKQEIEQHKEWDH